MELNNMASERLIYTFLWVQLHSTHFDLQVFDSSEGQFFRKCIHCDNNLKQRIGRKLLIPLVFFAMLRSRSRANPRGGRVTHSCCRKIIPYTGLLIRSQVVGARHPISSTPLCPGLPTSPSPQRSETGHFYSCSFTPLVLPSFLPSRLTSPTAALSTTLGWQSRESAIFYFTYVEERPHGDSLITSCGGSYED